MKRLLVAALVVLAAIIAVIGASILRKTHELIPWQTDFKVAQAESHQTGKPILLDFSADWCGPCQEMRRTTWSDASVATALHDYIPMQVNIDANPDLASQFQVRAIPHIVVVNSRGDILKVSEGAMDPTDFLHWLGNPGGR
jgi:thiol:disulfide interchange protein